MTPQIPRAFLVYECQDYFQDRWPDDGLLDEALQMLIIVPLNEVYEMKELGFLAVGRSGVDGIDFGYRKHHSGLWAFYPIEQEFKFMADSIQVLVDGWCSGRLSV